MASVVTNQGPLNPETSILPGNETAILASILMELKAISLILRQGFNITDEDAALRNSLTVSDLTLVK